MREEEVNDALEFLEGIKAVLNQYYIGNEIESDATVKNGNVHFRFYSSEEEILASVNYSKKDDDDWGCWDGLSFKSEEVSEMYLQTISLSQLFKNLSE